MTDRPDIWHYLKDHEIFPSAEVSNRLRIMLKIDDGLSDPALGVIERVQDHEAAPPAELEAMIAERCGALIPERRKRGGMRWYVAAAAACLVLVVAGGIIMVKKEKPAVVTAGPSVATVLPSRTDSGSQKGNVVRDMTVAARPDSAAAVKVGREPSFSVGGEAVHVADNDLLTAFASYTYPEIPDYLLREGDQPLRIYVDQYTNIFVSKNMRALLKELYEVRNNGKPTRKARRARRRLDDWKEKDEKRWDKSGKANPLDPVDLGEFIFK